MSKEADLSKSSPNTQTESDIVPNYSEGVKSTIDTSQQDSNETVSDTPAKREDAIKQILDDNQTLFEKYKLQGPFVYELFACLVHSGGAMGGHYHAFILEKLTQ